MVCFTGVAFCDDFFVFFGGGPSSEWLLSLAALRAEGFLDPAVDLVEPVDLEDPLADSASPLTNSLCEVPFGELSALPSLEVWRLRSLSP